MNKNNDLITMPEVCRILGIKRHRVSEYLKQGVLKSVQYVPGGNHHFYRVDILKLTKSN